MHYRKKKDKYPESIPHRHRNQHPHRTPIRNKTRFTAYALALWPRRPKAGVSEIQITTN